MDSLSLYYTVLSFFCIKAAFWAAFLLPLPPHVHRARSPLPASSCARCLPGATLAQAAAVKAAAAPPPPRRSPAGRPRPAASGAPDVVPAEPLSEQDLRHQPMNEGGGGAEARRMRRDGAGRWGGLHVWRRRRIRCRRRLRRRHGAEAGPHKEGEARPRAQGSQAAGGRGGAGPLPAAR